MASVDLSVAAELAGSNGLDRCVAAEAVARPDGLLLRPSPDHLARVYVEVTTGCNLSCRTCVRNSWDEPLGHLRSGMDRRAGEANCSGPLSGIAVLLALCIMAGCVPASLPASPASVPVTATAEPVVAVDQAGRYVSVLQRKR
jgi:hypothetical protein